MTAALTLQQILPLLENVHQHGDKYTASCPVVANHQHADENPSLSLSEEGHRLLVHCFTGCRFEEIIAAAVALNGNPHKKPEPAAFSYTEAEIINLAEALIDEWKSGGPVADFLRARGISREASLALRLGATRRMFPNAGSSPALSIPLYRGHALVGVKYRATAKKDFLAETGSNMSGLYGCPDPAGKQILLLEGPLDVALAMSHGFNAVGIQAADTAPRKEDLELLGSYDTVFIVGDADRAGREAMNRWQLALSAERPEPLIRVSLGYKDIGDVYAAAPEKFQNTLAAILRQSRAGREYFTPDDLLTETELRGTDVQQPYVVDILVPRGQITMVFGEEKNGKTLLVTYLAKCVANRLKVFDKYATVQMPVLYLDLENTHFDLSANAAFFARLGSVKLTYRTRQTGVPALDSPGLLRYCERYKPLIILDSQTKFTGAYFARKYNGGKGSQWNPDQMSGFFDELLNLCAAGATIIIIHHCTRDESERYANSYMVGASVARAFAIISEDKPKLLHVRMQGVLFRGAEAVNENLIGFPVIAEHGCFGLDTAPRSMADRITEYVRSCEDGATREQIKQKLKGRDNEKVGVIRTMVADGRLVGAKKGGKLHLPFAPERAGMIGNDGTLPLPGMIGNDEDDGAGK